MGRVVISDDIDHFSGLVVDNDPHQAAVPDEELLLAEIHHRDGREAVVADYQVVPGWEAFEPLSDPLEHLGPCLHIVSDDLIGHEPNKK